MKEKYSHTIHDLGKVRLQWHCEAHGLFVDSYIIQRDTSNYNIKDLLPVGWEMRLGSTYPSAYVPYVPYDNGCIKGKGVILPKPKKLEDIAGVLHEIGHAQEVEKQTLQKLKQHWNARNRWNGPHEYGTPTMQDVYDVLEDECRAWDFAVQECRKLNVSKSTMHQIYEHIIGRESLGSYVHVMVFAIEHKGVILPSHRNGQEILNEFLQKYNNWRGKIRQECNFQGEAQCPI